MNGCRCSVSVFFRPGPSGTRRYSFDKAAGHGLARSIAPGGPARSRPHRIRTHGRCPGTYPKRRSPHLIHPAIACPRRRIARLARVRTGHVSRPLADAVVSGIGPFFSHSVERLSRRTRHDPIKDDHLSVCRTGPRDVDGRSRVRRAHRQPHPSSTGSYTVSDASSAHAARRCQHRLLRNRELLQPGRDPARRHNAVAFAFLRRCELVFFEQDDWHVFVSASDVRIHAAAGRGGFHRDRRVHQLGQFAVGERHFTARRSDAGTSVPPRYPANPGPRTRPFRPSPCPRPRAGIPP